MGEPLSKQDTKSTIGAHDQSEKALEANEVEQAQTIERVEPVQRAGFGSKLKRHCARFWWIHVIIFCICFLIIALCLVYVGMPRIAQHGVNESSLEITDLKFLDPTPDSFVMTQKAIIHSPSKFTPTLDPFTAATYFVANGTLGPVPMIDLDMPRIHALHPVSHASIENQSVKIKSLDQVSAYATAVLSNEFVSTALVGRTTLHIGKLPDTDINYNTTVTYKGLNGLAGFNVTGVRLNLTATPGTPNLKGFAYIPNPSTLTVAMGNVTLSFSTALAGVVGNATILDMTLVPGNNTLAMSAIVDQPKVIASMNAAGFVDLSIIGKESVYNGQHLTYYENALASNVLKLQMNVKQILIDSAKPAS